MRHGNLLVVSGPAGAGKGTLVSRLSDRVSDVWVSVSATTRAPRPGEIDGVHYFFYDEMIPAAKLIFIEPPSLEVLEARLRGRGTEDDAEVRRRMKTAEVELSRKMEYDVQLVNDDLDQATEALVDLVNAYAEQD